MAVTFMCPNLRCRKVLMAPDNFRGKRMRCTYCGYTLLVPKAKIDYFSKEGIVAKSRQEVQQDELREKSKNKKR